MGYFKLSHYCIWYFMKFLLHHFVPAKLISPEKLMSATPWGYFLICPNLAKDSVIR